MRVVTNNQSAAGGGACVLIIGPGDMGGRIARGLGAGGRVGEIVLAGLSHGHGPAVAGLVASTSDTAARFAPVDGADPAAVEQLIRRVGPDVIVQCGSLLSPWALGARSDRAARAVQAAGLGVALPMQLPIILAVMRAVRAVGFAGPVANLSFPDVTNVVLGRLGLAPTIGLGNVTMHQLRVRGALRAESGPGVALPLVRVIGQHHHVYGVMRAEPPADPADRVRVFLGEDGRRADDSAYRGYPFAAGVVYNEVTAAAAVATVEALLPGAAVTRISVPAPLGLPGGYPVRISDATVELDLPPGQQLDDAIAFNQRIGRGDGVAAVADDGTVTFTEQAAASVAQVAPWLAEPLRPDDAHARAARLRRLLDA
jgi:hypothetical protein